MEFRLKTSTNLDPLFIVDPSNHFDTHFSDFVEVRLLQANIPQYLNDPLPYTNARVLCIERKNRSV